MEELTLEKLLTDMRGTIDAIQKLIDENDIEGARAVFTQIQELIANENQIDLDVIDETVPPEEGQSYDNVLHQLLSNISGIIEVSHEEQITEDVIEIKKKELLKARADLKGTENNKEKNRELNEKISNLVIEISELETDFDEVKKIEEELKDIDEQIDEIFINGGEEEPEEIAKLKKLEEKQKINLRKIKSLEKERKEINEEIEKNKYAKTKDLDNLKADLNKVENELEILQKENEEISQSDTKLKYSILPEEIQQKLFDNAEKRLLNSNKQKFYKKQMEEMIIGKKSGIYEEFSKSLEKLQEEEKILEQERITLEKQAEIFSDKDRNYVNLLAEQKNLEKSISGLEASLAKEQEIAKNNKLDHSDENENKNNIKNIQEKLETSKKRLEEIEATLNEYKKDEIEVKPSKLSTLQQRRKELEQKQKGLEDKLRKTTTRTVVTDRLDMGAEARRVGDNIFKTSEIRKELSERNISREDFIKFYEQGIEEAVEIAKEIKKEKIEINEKIANIFIDPKLNIDLFQQAEEAYVSDNSELAISIYEQIRKNMLKDGSLNNMLQAAGFESSKITESNLDKFAEFVGIYQETLQKRLKELAMAVRDQRENVAIFENEIKIIRDEQKALEMLENETKEIHENSVKEKELRARQIKASMYGNDIDLQEEWDVRFNRFYENKIVAEDDYTYIDKDGNKQTIEYETIEDYDEYKEDAFFLNLEDYKTNLELSTKFRASGNDPYSLTPELIAAYEKAESIQEGAGEIWLEETIKNMEEYVSSFHGNVNEHAVKYLTYKTAGSALKAMKPVKGVTPATVKYASALENVGRFFGLRIPKFTRINEDGEKVTDIKGGLITLATDALVVGVAGVAVAAGPIGMATWGAAYAAKGIVIGGYQLAARREMKIYGDEIINNLPTPYKTTRDAKEIARKDYYRTHDKDGKRLEDGKTNGRLSTWFKAKTDKYIFRGRKARTEEAIVNERIIQSDIQIDRREDEAIYTIMDNIEKAKSNQATRIENTRKEIRSGAGTNDIYANPEAAKKEKEELFAQSVKNQALESKGKDRENINPDGVKNRRNKFKEEIKFKQTEELDKVVKEGGSISSTAVTETEKKLGEQNRVDRNRIIYAAILTGAFKLGIDYVAKGFETTYQEESTIETNKEAVYRTEDVTKTEVTTEVDPNKTLGEYTTDGGALKDTYGATATEAYDLNGNVDSIAAKTGNIEISLTEQGVATKAGEHVHAALPEGTDISKWTMDDVLENFQTYDPVNYAAYLKEAGLENATNSEISKYMIENGLYLQSNGDGWLLASKDNLLQEATEVVTGTKQVFDHWNITETEIPGEIYTEIDKAEIAKSIGRGVAAGAVATGVDKLHEAAHGKNIDEQYTETGDSGLYESAEPAEEPIVEPVDETTVEQNFTPVNKLVDKSADEPVVELAVGPVDYLIANQATDEMNNSNVDEPDNGTNNGVNNGNSNKVDDELDEEIDDGLEL